MKVAEPNVPDVILTLLEQIHNDMSAMRQELTDHIATEPAEWAKILSDLQAKAFPGGDPEGHRKAHEDEMATIAARADFWKKMLFEVTKYGLLGVVGWVAYQLWVAFLHGPGK